MKNILTKLTNKKVFILVGLLIVAYGFLSSFARQSYQLTIKVQPPSSVVSINQKEQHPGDFDRKLVAGNYNIKVENRNFETYEQTIALNKDVELNIVLKPAVPEVFQDLNIQFINTEQKQITSVVPTDQGAIVGIDPSNEHLIQYISGSFRTIFAKPVKNYSLSYPLVAVIEKGNQNQITLINLQQNTTAVLEGGINSIVNTAITADNTTLYFLGSYNLATRKSILYQSSLTTFNPTQIISTEATEIQPLVANQILLYTHGEALDGNEVSILNLVNKEIVKSFKVNKYSLSPDKTKIFIILSNEAKIVDVNTLEETSLSFNTNNLYTWKDSNTILSVNNLDPGVILQEYDLANNAPGPLIRVPSLDNVFIRSIYGVFNNKLLVRTAENTTLEISLP